jgi:hypothetical protein
VNPLLSIGKKCGVQKNGAYFDSTGPNGSLLGLGLPLSSAPHPPKRGYCVLFRPRAAAGRLRLPFLHVLQQAPHVLICIHVRVVGRRRLPQPRDFCQRVPPRKTTRSLYLSRSPPDLPNPCRYGCGTSLGCPAWRLPFCELLNVIGLCRCPTSKMSYTWQDTGIGTPVFLSYILCTSVCGYMQLSRTPYGY